MRRVGVWILALALGCGGAEPRPEAQEPDSRCDRRDEDGGCIADTLGQGGEGAGGLGCEEGDDCVLVYGAAPSGAPQAPASRPPREPSAIVPASSRRAGPPAPERGFELADAQYARAMSISLDVGVAETLQAMVNALTQRIDERARTIAEARSAYDDAARDPAMRSRAAIRVGDLLDALATDLLEVPIRLPRDVEHTIASASPDVQSEVRLAVEARMREVLSRRAAQVACLALERYRAAVDHAPAGDGAAAPRANEQIAAYGEPFVASCTDRPR